MREKEVKQKIGEKNWFKFLEWMTGQTYGIYPDGEADFYENDVDAFATKLTLGYDRQKNPFAWD